VTERPGSFHPAIRVWPPARFSRSARTFLTAHLKLGSVQQSMIHSQREFPVRTTVISVSLLILMVGADACGGKSSQGQAAPVPLSQAPDVHVSAICNGLRNCCASRGFTFNAAACDTYTRSLLSAQRICSPPGAYDPQAAGDCYAEVEANLSVCSNVVSSKSACNRICNGTLAAGTICTADRDCAKPVNGTVSCTSVGTTSSAAVCVVHPHGKVGDGCTLTCTSPADGSSESCDGTTPAAGDPTPTGTAGCYTNDGLYCKYDYTCSEFIPVGQSCDHFGGCQSGAYCDVSTTTATCYAKVAVGAPCSGYSWCVDDAYCAPSQVCTPKKAVGEACANYSECAYDCDTATHLCVAADTAELNITAASCADPTQI